MIPIHTILHPTDFSEQSGHALHLACALARDHGAHLVILHVGLPQRPVYGEWLLPPPSVDDAYYEAQSQLDDLRIPDGCVEVERRLEIGAPAAEILRVATEIPVDLIVMGTHGRTGLSRLLMGSVAEKVMRRATCPVLTVKSPFPVAAMAGADKELHPAGAL